MLEREIRSQVNGGPVTTYKAQQSFSELPGDRHGVSANASKTKPVKLLAVFVADTNETEPIRELRFERHTDLRKWEPGRMPSARRPLAAADGPPRSEQRTALASWR